MNVILAIVLSLCALLGSCSAQGEVYSEKPEPMTTAGPEEDTWQKSVSMTFESFDGGGPEYSITIEDPEMVSYELFKEYDNPDHEMMDGAGYDITYVFTGKKPGTTTMTISVTSPVGENYDDVYTVTVDEELNISIKDSSDIKDRW